MAIFLLIRHGENDWVGKRLAGQTPGVHLNEKGRRQAQAVAEALKDVPLKAIYSSPMERAMETAQPLADLSKLAIQVENGLIEIDFGKWQGKTIKQLRRMKLWKTVQTDPQNMRFPDGKSFVEAQTRLVASLEALNQQYEEKDVIACFSHSDSIRLLVAHYLAMPINAFQRISIQPTSLSVIMIS